jgi:hypothetical protein
MEFHLYASGYLSLHFSTKLELLFQTYFRLHSLIIITASRQDQLGHSPLCAAGLNWAYIVPSHCIVQPTRQPYASTDKLIRQVRPEERRRAFKFKNYPLIQNAKRINWYGSSTAKQHFLDSYDWKLWKKKRNTENGNLPTCGPVALRNHEWDKHNYISKSSSGSSSESGLSSSESRKYIISPLLEFSFVCNTPAATGAASFLLSARDLRPS